MAKKSRRCDQLPVFTSCSVVSRSFRLQKTEFPCWTRSANETKTTSLWQNEAVWRGQLQLLTSSSIFLSAMAN